MDDPECDFHAEDVTDALSFGFKTTEPMQNGGTTRTLALKKSSPAIDLIPKDLLRNRRTAKTSAATSARRSNCDSGAFERKAKKPLAQRFGERLGRGVDGALDRRLVVGERDEPRLELRRGRVDAAVEQRPGEAPVGVEVAGRRAGEVARRLLGEERRDESGTDTTDTGRPSAAPRRPLASRSVSDASRRYAAASRFSSVASPAATASGLPLSVPAW